MASGMMNSLLEKLHIASPEAGAPAQEPAAEDLQKLRENYEKANQAHVFTFYEELSTTDKAALFTQLQS
jgi:UDP-N-acetylglucosamine/UDP-N-acetylgalactosamine diphosphorylase